MREEHDVPVAGPEGDEAEERVNDGEEHAYVDDESRRSDNGQSRWTNCKCEFQEVMSVHKVRMVFCVRCNDRKMPQVWVVVG